jgi:cytoskeletal protein RodZ
MFALFQKIQAVYHIHKFYGIIKKKMSNEGWFNMRKKPALIAFIIVVAVGITAAAGVIFISNNKQDNLASSAISSETVSSGMNSSDVSSSVSSSSSSKNQSGSSSNTSSYYPGTKKTSSSGLDSSYIDQRNDYLKWTYSNWQKATDSQKVDCADIYANEMGYDRSSTTEMGEIFLKNPNKTLEQIIKGQ